MTPSSGFAAELEAVISSHGGREMGGGGGELE